MGHEVWNMAEEKSPTPTHWSARRTVQLKPMTGFFDLGASGWMGFWYHTTARRYIRRGLPRTAARSSPCEPGSLIAPWGCIARRPVDLISSRAAASTRR